FANQNITIQNSVFGMSSGFYSLMVDTTAALPSSGIHLRYNTFTKGVSVSGVASPDSDFVGNVAAVSGPFCARMLANSWNVRDNLILGPKACGGGDRSSASAA